MEYEKHCKEKRRVELEKQRQREEEQAARDRERALLTAKRQQIARERLAQNEARRAAVEEENRRKFETIERERREKSEKAAQMAREAEEKKQADFAAAKKVQEEKDQARTLRIQKERETREEENRIQGEIKQRHITTIRVNRDRRLEAMRTQVEQKWADARIRFEEWRRRQEEELAERRKSELAKIEEGRRMREERETERHESVLQAYEAREERSAEVQRTMQVEGDERRKWKAIEDAFLADDHLARHTRATALQVTDAVEKALDYEKRLQRIATLERMRKKQYEDGEMARRQLEAEKNKVLSGGLTTKELATKNPVQLQELADKMGIDLDELRKKARESRRGRKFTHLPPIEPAAEEPNQEQNN
jgi:hypothetical protein